MTGIDYISYLAHDGRWWLNQYYEYYTTFGHPNEVAFNAFNHTGLIFNQAYPQLILKIIETPLVLLKIVNPYIVMGTIRLLTLNATLVLVYLATKYIDIDRTMRLSYATLLTLLMVMPSSPSSRGFTNSTPQSLALIFIIVGVIAILNKNKPYIMAIASFGMLMSSITTSLIGLITLALVFFMKPTWAQFKQLFSYGLIGALMAVPFLYPTLKTVALVNRPDMQGISNTITANFIWEAHPFTITLYALAIVLLAVPIILVNQSQLNKYAGYVITSYLLLSTFPKFSGWLMTPIQKNTFFRFWPVLIIITMFWLIPLIKPKFKLILNLVTLLAVMISSLTLILYPIWNAVSTPIVQDYTAKKWDDVYAAIGTNFLLKDKSGQYLMNPLSKDTAIASPDYTPKDATLVQNTVAYTSPHDTLAKYGVIRKAIGSDKLLVTIHPNHTLTPLGVWHYEFIKYNVSTNHGKIVVKHGMFYYKGSQSVKITIES